MPGPDLLARLMVARRELRRRGAAQSDAMLLLTPEALRELNREWPASAPPREVFGLRFLVCELPDNMDFVLMVAEEPVALLDGYEEEERTGEPQPLYAEAPCPPRPVEAPTFDEWLEKTTRLLADCERMRR